MILTNSLLADGEMNSRRTNFPAILKPVCGMLNISAPGLDIGHMSNIRRAIGWSTFPSGWQAWQCRRNRGGSLLRTATAPCGMATTRYSISIFSLWELLPKIVSHWHMDWNIQPANLLQLTLPR